MASQWFVRSLIALSSTIIRTMAYVFLQWIPGSHGPVVIFPATIVYSISLALWWRTHSSKQPSTTNNTKEKQGHGQRTGKVKSKYSLLSTVFEAFNTIAFSIPGSDFPALTLASIGINILLICSVADFVVRAPLLYPSNDLRFTRVGYVSSDTAMILIRDPYLSNSIDVAYGKVVTYPEDTQRSISVYGFNASTDFTQSVILKELESQSEYQYKVSNGLSGTFTTTAAIGSAQADNLRFLTTSCIKAAWPYNPQAHPLAIPGYHYLSNVLESLPLPAAFMLFLGDFIYVDVPLRLGSSVAHYRSEYRRVYASPSWSLSSALQSLPWIHTLDDHEIANDWSSGNTTEPFPAASDPFWHYHVSVNPPRPQGTNPENTTYFTFTQGPASFFMLDTRRYRTEPEPNPAATFLGPRQLADLIDFIERPEPEQVKWKIIASSVPFCKLWRFGTKDTWGGYLQERSLVLHAMHQAEAELGVRIVVLSGDRHEFGAIRFPPPNAVTNDSGPHEYSVGPLSQFYLPIRTFKQIDDEDVALKYLPDGNTKFGVIDIKNTGEGKSLMKYILYIDGKVAWEHLLTSPGPEYLALKQRMRR